MTLATRGALAPERAWGYRDRGDMLPCVVDTMFGIASGSKTFTAFAICRLLDGGVISLDDSVLDCVPLELPGIDLGVNSLSPMGSNDVWSHPAARPRRRRRR